MPRQIDVTTFTEELLKQDFVWNDIFAVRDTDRFIIWQPPAIQGKIDRIKALMVEDLTYKKLHTQKWNIVSKHGRPTVHLTRVDDEFIIHLKTANETVLWLEGVDCKKHALLHIHALMGYLLAYR